MQLLILLALLATVGLLVVLFVRGARSEEQSRSLGAEVARLSATVDARLRASQESSDRRLADAGQAMAHVRERLGVMMEATRHLETVGESINELQSLLRVQSFRGSFGEAMLEELLRQVLPRQCYELQYTFRSGERVDAVIRLADHIVPIDSKFPLDACARFLAAGDDATIERERRAMLRSMKERVDEIATKYIRPDEGTSDFALMYVPAESVYYEAWVRDQRLGDGGLFAYAMERRVIPVSPHTFYAYLSAILFGLKGLRVEAQAREIRGELAALAQEFRKFSMSFELVGRHLSNARKQYEETDRARARLDGHLTTIGMDALADSPAAGDDTAASLPIAPEAERLAAR